MLYFLQLRSLLSGRNGWKLPKRYVTKRSQKAEMIDNKIPDWQTPGVVERNREAGHATLLPYADVVT